VSKKNQSVAVHREPSTEARPAASEGWGSMMSLRDEIDRLFDDFGSGFWRRPLTRWTAAQTPEPMAWRLSPVVEVVDCNGEYRIAAEVPGLAAGDVDITLHDSMLTIRGEKTEEKREEKADYLLSERRYGAFHRTIPLPSGADAEHIRAELANGVLTITMRKTAAAKAAERKIEVKAA
jgi:HSP20 family protein